MEGRHRRGPQRPYPRVARVNALLQEILAEEVERLADADDRLRLTTLTAVDCDPGLRQATVYLASLSDEVAEALDEHRRGLQHAVGAQARLKRTPTLAFAADPGVRAGAAVDEALRRAKPVRERHGEPGEDPDAPAAGAADES